MNIEEEMKKLSEEELLELHTKVLEHLKYLSGSLILDGEDGGDDDYE